MEKTIKNISIIFERLGRLISYTIDMLGDWCVFTAEFFRWLFKKPYRWKIFFKQYTTLFMVPHTCLKREVLHHLTDTIILWAEELICPGVYIIAIIDYISNMDYKGLVFRIKSVGGDDRTTYHIMGCWTRSGITIHKEL